MNASNREFNVNSPSESATGGGELDSSNQRRTTPETGSGVQPYADRLGRNTFIATEFGPYLGGSILNIGGGGHRYLAGLLPDREHVELDVSGDPDVRLDLETELPLPFHDEAFDTVVCTDVLEHLNNLHAVVEEIFRIARNHVIISLPNPARGAMLAYALGRTPRRKSSGGSDVGALVKFYGLPFDQPVDRHKWFFSYSDAEAFFREHARRHRFAVARMFGFGFAGRSFRGRLARGMVSVSLGERARKDLFYRNFWCVLTRGDTVVTP